MDCYEAFVDVENRIREGEFKITLPESVGKVGFQYLVDSLDGPVYGNSQRVSSMLQESGLVSPVS